MVGSRCKGLIKNVCRRDARGPGAETGSPDRSSGALTAAFPLVTRSGDLLLALGRQLDEPLGVLVDVILPQRVAFPIGAHHDAPEVGVALEHDAEKVVGLSLVPVPPSPQPPPPRTPPALLR